MAKAFALVSALCFLALASFAHAQTPKVFHVFGMVYCDPCNVEFQTKISKAIEGAKVQVQCRNRDNDTVTLSVEGTTDKEGTYRMAVEGDHEEEICEVGAISSPTDCNTPFGNTFKARVLLTENNGVQGTERYANPLGFKSNSVAAECKDVLAEMGIVVV